MPDNQRITGRLVNILISTKKLDHRPSVSFYKIVNNDQDILYAREMVEAYQKVFLFFFLHFCVVKFYSQLSYMIF